jgi:secreted PhoX family phosphatase
MGTVDPNSGEVYFTLTNNNRRDMTQIDAVNPRAENNFGQIVRWSYEGGDHALPTFALNLFVIAGTPRNSLVFNGETLGDDSTFACPDGLWCDAQSRLWIQTDMGDIGPNQTDR